MTYDELEATPQSKLQAIMDAHKLTIDVRRVESRPDDMNSMGNHAAFDLRNGQGQTIYSGFYSAGDGAALPDTLAEFQAAYKRARKSIHHSPSDIVRAWETRYGRNSTVTQGIILAIVRKAWLPKPLDIFQGICSDATEESFENFCGDMCFDTDSRKAERLWHVCRECSRVLRQYLGNDYDAALDAAREF